MKHRVVVATLALAAVWIACRRASDGAADAEPVGAATTHAAELAVPERGRIETVDVSSDRAVLVVVGEGARARQPIVHLHGMCAEAKSDLEAWSSGARAHGTVIALEGDVPCAGGGGGRTWSSDVDLLDRRIDAAVATVRTVRGVDLDAREIVLVGESIGASRVAALAARSPDLYSRLILIGVRKPVSPERLAGVKAIAILAGEEAAEEPSRSSAQALSVAGLDARLWTLPDAADADAMGEALAFVTR